MKKGFTLVELSIVLVIIGLLIGGVLVAQSLIDTAKIQRLGRQLQQYDVAIDQFVDRYRNLPGDTDLFPVVRGAATANDGDIDQTNRTVLFHNGFFNGEIAYFWKHLSDAGMLQTKYSEDASSGIRSGVNIPETPYSGVGIYVADEWSSTGGELGNVYWISSWDSSTDHQMPVEASSEGLPNLSAMSIDVKYDDGDDKEGEIRTPLFTSYDTTGADPRVPLMVEINSLNK